MIYDTSTGYEDQGCCPPAPEPIVPAYEPPAPAPLPGAMPTPAPLVITADPAATNSLYPDSAAVDRLLAEARAAAGNPPSLPAMPAGALPPTPADPSLWSSTLGPGGLFPTGDTDRDGVDNASDSAPFTPATRRP